MLHSILLLKGKGKEEINLQQIDSVPKKEPSSSKLDEDDDKKKKKEKLPQVGIVELVCIPFVFSSLKYRSRYNSPQQSVKV